MEKDLSQIVLEVLFLLNAACKKRERLIDIAVDGKVDEAEISDFVSIQLQLEKIAETVDSLQLWVKRKLASGMIDKEIYNDIRKSCEESNWNL
jgi:hypothetical protein